MFPKGFIAALLLIFSTLGVASALKDMQNFNPVIWDTNQIWLDNDAAYRQINIGNKLKGPNDDTFRVFTVQSNDARLALLFTDTSHTPPMKWRSEIVDIGVFCYYGARIGDVDRDGDNDFVYGRYVSPYYLLRARWDGAEWIMDTLAPITGANLAIDIGDADNDGYADDIIYSAGLTSNSRLYWAHWSGSAWDTTRIWNGDGRNIFGIAIGNFDASNGDSNEIVAATWGTVNDGGRIMRLRWTGSNWDTLTLWKATDNVAFSRVAIGDFDASNSGKEIAAANGFATESVNRGAVFEIFGSGAAWQHRPIYIPTPPETTNARGMAVGDVIDNNQGEEVVFSNSAGRGYKLRAVYGSDTSWSSEEIFNIGAPSYCVAIGNVNKYRNLNQEIGFTGDARGVYEAEQKSITRDVSVTSIESPTGIINLGATTTPACSIYNYGSTTATYSVRLKIGTTYDTVALVSNHLPGTRIYINNFPDWTALLPGSQVVTCSTELTDDENTTNDKITGSVFVSTFDAQTMAIIQPTGIVNLNDTVTPQAIVRNNSNIAQTFPVRFTITDGYSDSKNVTLGPNAQTTVDFGLWTANALGIFTTKCSTGLSGDMNLTNDTIYSSIFVQNLDAQPILIIRPTGSFILGDTVTPQVTVRNNGNTTISFPVLFTISDGYTNTQTVSSLAPGATTTVNFNLWTAATQGNFQTRCSTGQVGDRNPANDTVSGSVSVNRVDAQTVAIIQPTGIFYLGDTITPKTMVKNNGSTAQTFPVRFIITDGYIDSTNVTLDPDSQVTVNFALWTANTAGIFQARCSTGLVGDMNHSNDTISDSVLVRILDVGTTAILAPIETINLGSIITPQAKVKNFGNTDVTFDVNFSIDGSAWSSTKTVTNLNPNEERTIDFDDWTAESMGTLGTKCTTQLVGDMQNGNDRLESSVIVQSSGGTQPGVWVRMADIPITLSSKKPKSGSCIAGLNGKIYFLKASNTQDFAMFTPNGGIGTWTPIDTMPLGTKVGGDGKKPKKGASMTAYAPTKDLYVLRGNNTPGFWKFHTDSIGGDTLGWKKLANITTGLKNPKDGSGMVVITKGSNDYIFTMKGSKTDEFYLYDIAANTWTPTPTKPGAGASGKIGYKKGSCLAYDEVNNYVYVLKGNYGDFFRYNVTNEAWTELKRYNSKLFIARDGKKKKIGEGSGLVCCNNAVYLLKGGGTREFWKYEITADTWVQMNPADTWDIPSGSGKKVKGGGGLIKSGEYFYVAKGANTQEFYRHTLPSSAIVSIPSQLTSDGVMGNKPIKDELKLSIAPNPAINVTAVRYSLSVSAAVNFKLYNVTGTLVKSYTNSTPTKDGVLMIDTRSLPSGVYVLRFNSGEIKTIRKLVLEK